MAKKAESLHHRYNLRRLSSCQSTRNKKIQKQRDKAQAVWKKPRKVRGAAQTPPEARLCKFQLARRNTPTPSVALNNNSNIRGSQHSGKPPEKSPLQLRQGLLPATQQRYGYDRYIPKGWGWKGRLVERLGYLYLWWDLLRRRQPTVAESWF
ncbi:hypothetical protein CCHR01_15636 [Colletotrichum chrysophilum]|uniref:Uncharacterized protein n=1 Tax=Colletotrichum chrysophilum TaxID=1836956 RepID=A0AAD9A5D8_9PEZI|nr:hypothetical protein CCHR01_15636 [Colletotrichum chrysophilum]